MSSTLDRSVECVKNIVDFHQCRICDKADGSRMRYPCGHTACDDCVLEAASCLTCLTPPDVQTYTVAFDEPLTLRTKNASAFKKAFEENFQIDINKRHRLSEQLKIEQKLFPTPIKASAKYYNKRKRCEPFKNKENIDLTGEEITPLYKMATDKNNYVQQWLDRIEARPREPFSDLDVNRSLTLQNTPIKQRSDLIINKEFETSSVEIKRSTFNKRTHFKTNISLVNSQSKLNKHLKPIKKPEMVVWRKDKMKKDLNMPDKHLHSKMNDNNESGIVMDEEVISNNDTQSVVDKDKEAWLAVLRAEDSSPHGLECDESIRYTLDVIDTPNQREKKKTFKYNVIPFIKRSSLSVSCQFCKDDVECEQNQTAGNLKNVSITIENNRVLTTIIVSDNKNAVGSNTKRSTYAQTDIQALLGDKSIATHSDVANVEKECVKESQDLFTAEDEHIIADDNYELPQNNIDTRIPDSDSDEDLNQSSIIEVTADVHRISDPIDYGVLQELDKKDFVLKMEHKKRGKTPASSDSSEKENCDPNKFKRRKLERKYTKKQTTKKMISK